jgi:aryl-alcohol dehydrogenase-like predicted oxidoreductase
VDIYWLHRDDPGIPVGEIVDTLASLREDGRILYYGASNWSARRIDEAQDWAKAHREHPFIANQAGWSLAERPSGKGGVVRIDGTFHTWHRRRGLTLFAFNSQGSGYFGSDNVGWARAGFMGEAPRAASADSPGNRARLLRTIQLAERKGCTANQIALAYLLHQPFPVYPIIGTSKVPHVSEALAAAGVQLSAQECDWLSTGNIDA